MKLLTKELREKLPARYATEKLTEEETIVRCKFFTPDSSWTWYVIEFDGDDTFYGLVIGWEAELGYFSLCELESARGPRKMPIERDLHFKPVSLAEVRRRHPNL